MDANAARIALEMIRSLLGMPSTASPSDIVAKVRELKANRPELLRSRRVFRAPLDLGRVHG